MPFALIKQKGTNRYNWVLKLFCHYQEASCVSPTFLTYTLEAEFRGGGSLPLLSTRKCDCVSMTLTLTCFYECFKSCLLRELWPGKSVCNFCSKRRWWFCSFTWMCWGCSSQGGLCFYACDLVSAPFSFRTGEFWLKKLTTVFKLSWLLHASLFYWVDLTSPTEFIQINRKVKVEECYKLSQYRLRLLILMFSLIVWILL